MIFPIVSWVAIYFVVWWITLFAVLPFHARRETDEDDATPGAEASAPARLHGVRLVATTTLAATVVFLGIMWVLTQSYFTLDDVPFLPRYDDTPR